MDSRGGSKIKRRVVFFLSEKECLKHISMLKGQCHWRRGKEIGEPMPLMEDLGGA